MIEVALHLKELDYRSRESYKTLRTNISFSGVDNKAIVLTSCAPNEGKSSISVNLAKSLADAGKAVLLIDADLRRSVLMGRYLPRKSVEGLSHYLSGQSKLGEVIYKTDAGFHLIFAGALPPNPAELLGSKAFENLVRTMREKYHYVLIDTPPLGNVIDSVIVAPVCDAAIFVIEANTISRKYARKVKAQFERSGCKIIGAVLNKADIRQNKYYEKRYGMYGD